MNSQNSSTKAIDSQFNNVQDILNYLQESVSDEIVVPKTISTTRVSARNSNSVKSAKIVKKEKKVVPTIDSSSNDSNDCRGQVLPSGRVKYGPITVRPRKQPSKTLFTGRRSKYEVLSGDEEEMRRFRRERNRIAATKCREKRETVLTKLENEYKAQIEENHKLNKLVSDLKSHKQHLELLVSQKSNALQPSTSIVPSSYIQPEEQQGMVFGNDKFLTTINETPMPLLLPQTVQHFANDEVQADGFQHSTAPLTNSAYDPNEINYLDMSVKTNQLCTFSMNTSSLNRLVDEIHDPTTTTDNNNTNSMGLYNSAYGTSTCAQQHSSSSDDGSFLSSLKNNYVY